MYCHGREEKLSKLKVPEGGTGFTLSYVFIEETLFLYSS